MHSRPQKEKLGVSAVDKQFALLGWFMRVLPPPDEGIDAHVELADKNGRPNGRMIGVQIKAGPSYFKRVRDGGWLLRLKQNNVAYWRRYALPVVVVLHDPAADVAYWQVVRGEHMELSSGGVYSLFIPEDQILDASAVPALQGIANAGLPKTGDIDRVLRERRADLDLAWIERLAVGERLFLEAEEWVNKTSGRGSLRLVVEAEYGLERLERDWPYVFLPGASYADELPKLFPWATLKIDEERYSEHDRTAYVADVGVWDKEDDTYLFPIDFEEWRDQTFGDALRPYAESAEGEVAYWRLELMLNELGRETLDKARDNDMEAYFAELDDDWPREETVYNDVEPFYQGEYGDGPMGMMLERLVFNTAGDFDTLLVDEVLWTDAEKRRDVAQVILEHATGQAPTRALTDAFVNRFGSVLADEEGMGWTLDRREVDSWLGELRAGV